MKLRNILLYSVMLIIATACISAFHADIAQLSFSRVWQARDLIAMTTLLSLLNYALRIVRWGVYLKQLNYTISPYFLSLSYLSGFAFTLTPGKVGELIRLRYYQSSGVPTSSITAAFLIERITDVLVIAILAGLGLASASHYGIFISLTILCLLILLICVFMLPWQRWQLQTPHFITRLPNQLQKGFRAGLKTLIAARDLLNPRPITYGFVLGLIAWGAEGVGLQLLTQMFPHTALPLLSALGIYAIALIIGALSFLPGGLGSTEVVMSSLLVTQGFTIPEALLITLICRVLTLWLAIALGWLAVFSLRHHSVSTLPL